MSTQTDGNGQPSNLQFNATRRAERDVSEFLGLAKGVLADGTVVEAEAHAVRDWILAHPDASDRWPLNALTGRLQRIFADGHVDDMEREDLASLLADVVGGRATVVAGHDTTTNVPIDQPPPSLRWTGSVFVFTGKFVFAPRQECERQVIRLGGACESTTTKRTNYLVIGTFGSRDWAHTSYGRKIEKAVEYRNAGQPLAIINEDHWAESLPG